VAAGALLLTAPFALRGSLAAGVLAALALVLPSYWSLSWALDRSDKVFYAVFAGGALFRLAGLAATAFGVYRYTRLSLAAVLVSLVFMFMVLVILEMYFLQRQKR
jgi:hypothetical protein